MFQTHELSTSSPVSDSPSFHRMLGLQMHVLACHFLQESMELHSVLWLALQVRFLPIEPFSWLHSQTFKCVLLLICCGSSCSDVEYFLVHRMPWPGVVTHACNPSAWEEDQEGVRGQPVLWRLSGQNIRLKTTDQHKEHCHEFSHNISVVV